MDGLDKMIQYLTRYCIWRDIILILVITIVRHLGKMRLHTLETHSAFFADFLISCMFLQSNLLYVWKVFLI